MSLSAAFALSDVFSLLEITIGRGVTLSVKISAFHFGILGLRLEFEVK